MEKEDKRKTYRGNPETGLWDLIDFSDLKEGDVFALYEENGDLVGTYTAKGKPTYVDGWYWSIEARDYYDH